MTIREFVGQLRRASRYDLPLAAIPAAFLLGALAGSTPAVPTVAALTTAAAVIGLVMLDALFIHPPRQPSAGRPGR